MKKYKQDKEDVYTKLFLIVISIFTILLFIWFITNITGCSSPKVYECISCNANGRFNKNRCIGDYTNLSIQDLQQFEIEYKNKYWRYNNVSCSWYSK